MFLSEVSMIDVFLEGLKVIGMFFLLLTIINAGRRYPALAGRDWKIVTAGFILMLIGFLFDWSDEFIDYVGLELDFIQAFIEEVGLIGGLFLVTLGFNRWFNFVSRFMGVSQS